MWPSFSGFVYNVGDSGIACSVPDPVWVTDVGQSLYICTFRDGCCFQEGWAAREHGGEQIAPKRKGSYSILQGALWGGEESSQSMPCRFPDSSISPEPLFKFSLPMTAYRDLFIIFIFN